MAKNDSILISMSRLLGIDGGMDQHFNTDLVIHINTIFNTLCQLGVGPEKGYVITGIDEVWGDFLGGSIKLESVKSYIYLRLRLLFDPPTNSFLLDSIKEQINELEWRLNVTAEGDDIQ